MAEKSQSSSHSSLAEGRRPGLLLTTYLKHYPQDQHIRSQTGSATVAPDDNNKRNVLEEGTSNGVPVATQEEFPIPEIRYKNRKYSNVELKVTAASTNNKPQDLESIGKSGQPPRNNNSTSPEPKKSNYQNAHGSSSSSGNGSGSTCNNGDLSSSAKSKEQKSSSNNNIDSGRSGPSTKQQHKNEFHHQDRKELNGGNKRKSGDGNNNSGYHSQRQQPQRRPRYQGNFNRRIRNEELNHRLHRIGDFILPGSANRDEFELEQVRLKKFFQNYELAKPINLTTNTFKLAEIGHEDGEWDVYQHHIDLKPTEDVATYSGLVDAVQKMEKKLMEEFGFCIVSPTNKVYSRKQFTQKCLPMSIDLGDNSCYSEAEIRFINALEKDDPKFNGYQHCILRYIMASLDMKLVDEFMFNFNSKEEFPQHDILKGFFPQIGHYSRNQILFLLDPKVEFINHKSVEYVRENFERKELDPDHGLKEKLIKPIYEDEVYRFESFDEKETALSPMKENSENINYINYFRQRYDIKIEQAKQHILLARQAFPDTDLLKLIYLVPELCRIIGEVKEPGMIFHDFVKANATFELIQQQQKISPEESYNFIMDFRKKLEMNVEALGKFSSLALQLGYDLVKCPGKVLTREEVITTCHLEPPTKVVGCTLGVQVDLNNNWRKAFRDYPHVQFHTPKHLVNWVAIISTNQSDCKKNLDSLIAVMKNLGRKLGVIVHNPKKVIDLAAPRVFSYPYLDPLLKLRRQGEPIDIALVVFSDGSIDSSTGIFRDFAEQGILVQGCLASEVHTASNHDVLAMKLLSKMVAKLGGQPWRPNVDFTMYKKSMFIGYDIFHSRKEGLAAGGFVASSDGCFNFYNNIHILDPDNEDRSIFKEMMGDLENCLKQYKEKNGDCLPDRIFVYRGVQFLTELYIYVRDEEFGELQTTLNIFYNQFGLKPPKLSFIIINENSHVKFFPDDLKNPPAGTLVDEVVTHYQFPSFYLVSTATESQDFAKPVHYIVRHNTQKMLLQELEVLTYKLCFLDFSDYKSSNLPVPYLYAKKLTSSYGGFPLGLRGSIHEKLSTSLHYI